MQLARWIAVAVAAVLPLGPARAVPKKPPQDVVKERLEADGGTPFQRKVKQKLKERKDNGKHAPRDQDQIYEFSVTAGDGKGWGRCETSPRCEKDAYVVKAVGRTFVHYEGPHQLHDAQPGHDKAKWPLLVALDPDHPGSSKDYSEEYRAGVQREIGDKILPEDGGPRVMWKDEANPDAPLVFGEEPQDEEVVEEITYTFPEGQQQAEAFFRALAAAEAGEPGAADVLMGFTYSGPNIDYTIGSSKRICIFGWCFYIWDIKAGFALDWGLGLRIPARSQVAGPLLMVAGETYDFQSTLEVVGWEAPQYGLAGASPEGGNEFVLRLYLFAGAKVIIVGINICPWCQYVELDEDFGESFTPPFGEGQAFPMQPFPIELKSWDYGILGLAVGMNVEPRVGSSKVTAMGGGREVVHDGPGTVTFPVKACISGGSHESAVTLNEYRYYFNEFVLRLGAYLDFSVLGYGAWNPQFPLIDLDLGTMLGSLDLYLGDHVQCDWRFNCTNRPVLNETSLPVTITDETPPETWVATRDGTPGTHGWWTSSVAETLAAKDLPEGCGIGVARTERGLSEAALEPGSTFDFTAEGATTLYYRSVDADGKTEPVRTEVVRIDKTPPTIGGAPTEPKNGHGWYNRAVTVAFHASDDVSGVESLTPSETTLASEGADQTAGSTAVNFAGLSASFKVEDIDIDLTKPVVHVVVPSPTVVYKNTATFLITWTAEDALSGIDTDGGTLNGEVAAQGQLVDLVLLGGGNHVVAASATDKAGNENGDSVTFLVDVDIDGLLAAVNKVCELEWATKAGTCTSLRAKVLAAKASLAAGLMTDARGQLGAFLNELDAQEDKSLLDRGYRLLRTDALWVLEHYVLPGA